MFRFVSFRFVSFRFDLFRFVSICFVSFRFVSFRSVSFRSVSFLFRCALYRDPKLQSSVVTVVITPQVQHDTYDPVNFQSLGCLRIIHHLCTCFGKSDVPADEKHPSVCAIKDNMNIHEELTFKPVSTNFVQKQINSISVKKATGVDNISSKLLRIAQPVVTQPLTTLINMSLEHSTFPDALKKA